MNPRMWSHGATQANVAALRALGVQFVGPDEGETAEGEVGIGRMAEPEDIFRPRAGAARRVGRARGQDRARLGGGNPRAARRRSVRRQPRVPGRMGVALAEEARRRGADVTLLAANLSVPAPVGVDVVETPTAQAMLDAALARADADLVLMAAAPADYRPAETRTTSARRTTVPGRRARADD